MRLREAGRTCNGRAERGNRTVDVVAGLQCQAHVVPRRGVVAVHMKRAPVAGDGLVGAIGGGERQPQVVVDFRIARRKGHRAFEQRQRVVQALALDHHDAEIVQRQRMVGRERQRGLVVALRSVDVVALVRSHAARGERIGGLGRSRSRLVKRWAAGFSPQSQSLSQQTIHAAMPDPDRLHP